MIGETVLRIRAGQPTGVKDRYGKPILGPDVEVELRGAMFAPGTSTEPVAVGRESVTTNDVLYFRGPVDVLRTDRIRARGLVRTVEGRPDVWRRNGRTVGVVVQLQAIEG